MILKKVVRPPFKLFLFFCAESTSLSRLLLLLICFGPQTRVGPVSQALFTKWHQLPLGLFQSLLFQQQIVQHSLRFIATQRHLHSFDRFQFFVSVQNPNSCFKNKGHSWIFYLKYNDSFGLRNSIGKMLEMGKFGDSQLERLYRQHQLSQNVSLLVYVLCVFTASLLMLALSHLPKPGFLILIFFN